MTLVVTSVSKHGISVVADRAVTRRDSASGNASVLPAPATKAWYGPVANVSLAAWGSTRVPVGIVYQDWLADFARTELGRLQTPGTIAGLLADQMKGLLEPCRPTPWRDLRRGVHVAGFEGGIPVIYHVHMGTPELASWPKSFRDFPDIHGRGESAYRGFLAGGGRAQLRNGYPELFASVSSVVAALKVSLEAEFEVTIPSPTLRGQAALDKAMVRLAAGMLASAEVVQAVSEDVDVIAFGPDGLIDLDGQSQPAKLLRMRGDLGSPPTQSAV